MKRPRLRLRGLLERRATLGGFRGSGSAAHPPHVRHRELPARPLQTSAWRPAWLQGELTIGGPRAGVKYPSQVIPYPPWLTRFSDEYAQKGDVQIGHLALQ